MIKKTLYPKTKRVSHKAAVTVSEKLDGSNIGFFNYQGRLLIAQRNYIFFMDEAKQYKDRLYKGMAGWLEDHGEDLLNSLNEGSGFFGEWIGMGKIGYGDTLDSKVYMFAKANISADTPDPERPDFEAYNLYWDRHLFIYPFVNQTIPDFIAVVPLVAQPKTMLTVEDLNKLYDEYCEKVGRNVEGFVVNVNGHINKYVRMKNGTLEDHKE